MKENYKAWDFKIEDFSSLKSEKEKLEFLLRFAVLAPSSHNTQPWVFQISQNTIKVYKELSRRLHIADVNDRQLSLSIGCSIENILVAAEYYGYLTDLQIENTLNKDNHVATIKFSSYQKPLDVNNSLLKYILLRKTNRNKYSNSEINNEVLNRVNALKNNYIGVHVINDKQAIGLLGKVSVLSSIESFIDSNFRKELSKYLKHNLTNSKIGMPGFAQGMPTPISFLVPKLIKHINLEKIAKTQNEDLFNKFTPYIVILSAREDTQKNWIEAGRIFQKISLIATKESISISPWGAPIETGLFYEDIKKIINIKERPLMLFRMGYALKETKISPRIPHNEVMK